MKELRQPSEVILKNGKTLEEVLELHEKWLNKEEGGERADLRCANLSYADLRGTNLEGSDLSEVDLSRADLRCANLSYANLYKANLSEANLSYVNLICVNLIYANLKYAKLRGTNLRGTNLRGTNLTYTDLSRADLSCAKLRGTNLTNTKFYLTNLYKAKGDFVNVGNIGSRNDTTHYFYNIDKVICGCFYGTMKQFEEKVKETYDEDDNEYKEYIIAIRTLKEIAELHMNN